MDGANTLRRPVVKPAIDVTPGPADRENGGQEKNPMLRFSLVIGAWFVGLFGTDAAAVGWSASS